MTTFATASPRRAIVGGIACLALTALIITLGASHIRNRDSANDAEFSLEVPDADILSSMDGADNIPIDQQAGASSPNAVEAEPELQPPSTAEAKPAPQPPEPTAAPFNAKTEPSKPVSTSVALSRPIVLAAGRFSISGKVLELDGIVPVAVNRQCTDTSGEGWPCGRMARTAFANLVRGRTIDCDVPSTEWSGTAKANCTLAEKDLSQWLVENGWAEAAAGSVLEAAAEAARAAGVGLYSPDPRRTKAAARSSDTTQP